MKSLPVGILDQLKVINYMQKYHLKPRDAYHLLTIMENNIDGFATFDNDFNKVFSAKILLEVI